MYAGVYLGAVATIFAYAAWGSLLHRYSAVVVTPFALLAPYTGVLSSAVIFGEVFHPMRFAGMMLIVPGLVIIVLKGADPAGTPAIEVRTRVRARNSEP